MWSVVRVPDVAFCSPCAHCHRFTLVAAAIIPHSRCTSLTPQHFPYGDYGMLTIDSEGFSHAVWGEGLGWVLGGNCYYARQMSHT